MAMLVDAIGWRQAFLLVAAAALAMGALYYAYVRDAPPDWALRDRRPESPREVVTGVAEIIRDRRLWAIFLIAFCGYSSIITVLALWGSTYLHDVHGLKGVARGNVLLAMTLGLALGQSSFAVIARWVGGLKRATMLGIVMAISALAGLALTTTASVEAAIVLMVLHGFAGGFTALVIAHGRLFYPEHLVGRGMTTTNMCVLAGVGSVQIATGGLIAAFPAVNGMPSPAAYGAVFAAVAAMLAIALIVYARYAPASASN
jgi:predicted MFS family arabinose efflux permease